MPGAAEAEIYFIAAMMLLILIISGAAVFFFFKQYRKEMKDKREREGQKATARSQAAETAEQGNVE